MPAGKLVTLFPVRSPKARVKINRGLAGPSAPTVRRRFRDGKTFWDRLGRPRTQYDFHSEQAVELKTRAGCLIVLAGEV